MMPAMRAITTSIITITRISVVSDFAGGSAAE